jgi:hypothetical protein
MTYGAASSAERWGPGGARSCRAASSHYPTHAPRTIATALAKDLTADIEEMRCSRYSIGGWSYWRAVYDSVTEALPPIEPLVHAPSQYELVVIAGPIWASHPATPVRTFLKQERCRLPRVAFRA